MREFSKRRLALSLTLTSAFFASNFASAQDAAPVHAAPAPVADAAPVVDAASMPATEAYEPAPQTYQAPQAYEPIAATEMKSCNCCSTPCCTKKKKEAAIAKMKGAYKGVFYANDFSYLSDPCYDGKPLCGESFKGLMGGKLDLGGEVRVRYHSEEGFRGRAPIGGNPSGLGLTGNDDEFWLTRIRLYSSYRVNEIFRVYGEYLYADSGGEIFGNRPIEENRGEMQNLFGDLKLTDSLSVRGGRQEILLGAQRMVSPLDWANTRRTFDGVRGTYKGDTWNVDGFFLHPVIRNTANEDKIDDTNTDVSFYGGYATRGDLGIGNLDAYYLGLDNDAANFSYHTLGTRVVGSNDAFLYEMEGGIQFGENSDGSDHSAGFATGGIGKQIAVCDTWKPTLWFWYDWASGSDDPFIARGDNGFDHGFPLAHKYNGFMDLFGRRNLHDINVQFITPVLGSKKVKLLVWYHHFFLDQQTTPYDVTMNPFAPSITGADKELGDEWDFALTCTLDPRTNVILGYSHFAPGAYYDTPGLPTNDSAQFFYMQAQKRF